MGRIAGVSADRRRVENSAAGPELIDTPRNAELRLNSNIAVIYFRVIAHPADHANRPIPSQPDLLAEIALGADQPLHLRIGGVQRCINGLRADAELLGDK